MKVLERNKAILLRKSGESVGEIAKIVGVSKGTVSRWVRNIELTPEQIDSLANRNPAINGQLSGGKKRKEDARRQRREFQRVGASMCRKMSEGFIAGCMLYWGEGDKSRCQCGMTNSDPELLVYYVNWLRRFFDIDESRLAVKVNVYLGNGLSIEEVENHWIGRLKLSKSNLKKSIINHFPTSSSGKKTGKLPYGTCSVRIADTSIVQKIYGAIKEYIGIRDDRWLD